MREGLVELLLLAGVVVLMGVPLYNILRFDTNVGLALAPTLVVWVILVIYSRIRSRLNEIEEMVHSAGGHNTQDTQPTVEVTQEEVERNL